MESNTDFGRSLGDTERLKRVEADLSQLSLTLGYLGKTIMGKMADVKAAVEQLGTEIMSEFDAFDSKIESKMQELIAAQTSAQSSGDSSEVDAVLQSIEQIRSDFRTKVQGKTDALTPQVVASAGVSDPMPAAPERDTIASADVDTIEAGQNPRLGGTVSDPVPTGGDTVGQDSSASADTVSSAETDSLAGADTVGQDSQPGFDWSAPADTITSGASDTVSGSGANTIDASEPVAGVEPVKDDGVKTADPDAPLFGNKPLSGDANVGNDTLIP